MLVKVAIWYNGREASGGSSTGSRRSRAEMVVNWARRHWEQSDSRQIRDGEGNYRTKREDTVRASISLLGMKGEDFSGRVEFFW